MARSRQAKCAERILDEWLSCPVAARLGEANAGYAAGIVEGFRSFVLRQGDRAALAALAVDRIVCASLLARELTMKARDEPKKEYVEMAIKANEHAQKLLAMPPETGERTRGKSVVGIGSRNLVDPQFGDSALEFLDREWQVAA